jgi:hypothetical protein
MKTLKTTLSLPPSNYLGSRKRRSNRNLKFPLPPTPPTSHPCDRHLPIMGLLRRLHRFFSLSAQELSAQQMLAFIRLCATLKRDILLPQPLSHSDPTKPPRFLPQSVTSFLAEALGISPDVVGYAQVHCCSAGRERISPSMWYIDNLDTYESALR